MALFRFFLNKIYFLQKETQRSVILFLFIHLEAMKPVNKILLFVFLVAGSYAESFGFGAPPPPGGGAPCWPPPCVPINKGIVILCFAALFFGFYLIYSRGKRTKNHQ
jgi:hypothetical protein